MLSASQDAPGHRLRSAALNLVFVFTAIALVHALGATRSAHATPPRLDVPFVPTPNEVVDRMLEMAKVQPDDYLIDLGSGDGRIVVAALRDYDVKSAMGVDIDPKRIEEARENAREANVEDRATFVQGDLFEMDFSRANVLTMYLLQSVNQRLRPVILEKLAPGTRVVSHAFDMGDWEPDQQDTVGGASIYLWIVPARVAGRWSLATKDGKDISLLLGQTYQKLEGNAIIDGDTTPLTHVRLQGANISFSIGTDDYAGVVKGDGIFPEDGTRDWHAQRR